MNIGLLVTGLEDKEVKKICIGAEKAARENDCSLVVFPGKCLISEQEEDNPYSYQYNAVFDYACGEGFDALIVDIDRIGKKAPILKKNAFIKKFGNIPVFTFSEQEGAICVNQVKTDHEQFEQQGYEAVYDVIEYIKTGNIPSPCQVQNFNYVEEETSEIVSMLSSIGYKLLNRKYPSEKAYKAFIENIIPMGIKNSGIFIYDKKINNSIKYWWNKPEDIVVKSLVVNGIIQEEKEEQIIKTDEILRCFSQKNPVVLIVGNIFVSDNQLGLFVTDLNNKFLTDYFFDSMISIVTGVTRVSYLERQLKKTNEELYEVQEELARDDSVLDHIGAQDYLTGGLNRRGFFAKAYDLLKDNFKPGSYAIVSYIHMESLKGINQMYGHDEGDRAVKKVAGILEEVFKGSIYGRIRGDEFAVIEITDEEGKAESIREEMSDQNARLLDDSTRYMNHLQYAICEFGYDDNLSLREMLKETDESLQRLKNNG